MSIMKTTGLITDFTKQQKTLGGNREVTLNVRENDCQSGIPKQTFREKHKFKNKKKITISSLYLKI